MQIRGFIIGNFRSLQNVRMDPLGNLVTIVGKNGSGKTNTVEALRLFFEEFDDSLIRGLGGLPRQLWYCEITEKPIDLTVAFELSEQERSELIPDGLLAALGSMENPEALTLRRQLVWGEGACEWRTIDVKIGNRYVIQQGKPTSKVAAVGPEAEAVGPRPEDGEEETRAQEVPSGEPPTEPAQNSDNGDLGEEGATLLKRVSRQLKNTLSVIPAVRSKPLSLTGPIWEREPFISRDMQETLVSLHDSLDDPTRVVQMDQIEARLEDIWPARWKLDFVAGQLFVREADLRVPISLEGGGHQEYLGFVHRLREKERIFVIEEPEAHLHSHLRKKLFDLMKETSESSQVFIVTHSEDFVAFDNPPQNWICEKLRKQTRVTRAQTADDLRRVLDILGAEPVDRLYPNKVLMVAGETEQVVVPIWLDTLGIEVDGLRTKIVPLSGEQDWRIVKSWIDRANETQTEAFLMVDDHGAPLVQRAMEAGLPEDRCLKLAGTIEDCYPVTILTRALAEWYDERHAPAELDPTEPMIPQIQKVLKERINLPKKKTVWKKPIGEAVASQMGENDLPKEVREFLRKLA